MLYLYRVIMQDEIFLARIYSNLVFTSTIFYPSTMSLSPAPFNNLHTARYIVHSCWISELFTFSIFFCGLCIKIWFEDHKMTGLCHCNNGVGIS